MTWQQLKERVYYLDGSLRDIYVHNTTKEDWQIWADLVNKNYKTSFHIYETEITKEHVDLGKVYDYWNGEHDNCSTATVFIDDIKVNAHFFTDQEIENDLTPKEFTSIEDHEKLIHYMKRLSKALNKKVILTPENMPEVILLAVDQDDVQVK